MQLRNFICFMAVILCGWLALTFVTDVPTKRYPKLDKHVLSEGLAVPDPQPQLVEATGDNPEISHVSVSH